MENENDTIDEVVETPPPVENATAGAGSPIDCIVDTTLHSDWVGIIKSLNKEKGKARKAIAKLTEKINGLRKTEVPAGAVNIEASKDALQGRIDTLSDEVKELKAYLDRVEWDIHWCKSEKAVQARCIRWQDLKSVWSSPSYCVQCTKVGKGTKNKQVSYSDARRV